MIEVKNLKKSYGSHRALHGISFNVERGHVYGFLGPNGAGKSTTMNIITGCLAASEGLVSINGHDIFSEPIEAKRSIGYLPEQPPLYLDMKVSEYLDFVGRAKGLRGSDLYSQIEEVVSLTGLDNVYDRLIKNLSKGYKQRVGIAQAMLGNPEVIILDEPTVGLDPIQIIEIRELIRSLSVTHTVILSSHILSEISAICDRIIIIAGGRIVANDTIEGLMRPYSENAELELLCKGQKSKISEAFSNVGAKSVSVEDTDRAGEYLVVFSYDTERDIAEAVWRAACGAGIIVLSMVPKVMTLEDVFISLTKEPEEAESVILSRPAASVFADAEDADGADEDDNDDDDDDDDGDDYKPLFS